MIKEAIAKAVTKTNLTEAEAEAVMREIMQGEATDAQIAAYLTALRMKGETVEEITGSARVMREKAVPITLNAKYQVDTCGTGGDMAHTFNISTTVAFVVAGAGVTVAKHGNRSVSSRSGSADVLQALGINIEIPSHRVQECLGQVGIAFLFAPMMHQAMKYAIGPRREVGIRTIFNILGPLTNPAKVTSQIMGVYDVALTGPLAQALGNLGAQHAFVVHGMDGLDEITTTDKTKISEFANGRVKDFYLHPSDFGMATAKKDDLKGGEARDNAAITMEILNSGKGPRRDVVLLNAAAGLTASGRAKDLKDGLAIAAESIDSGAALKKLDELKAFTNRP
jgi:anthranilate phosphoribosyltransferase